MGWFKGELIKYLWYGGDVCFFGESLGDKFDLWSGKIGYCSCDVRK